MSEVNYNFIDLTGRTFDRLHVIKRYSENTKYGQARWVCECKCGNIVIVTGKQLRKGVTRSCGCRQRDSVRKRNFKHGDAYRGHIHRLYGILYDMIRRCYDPRRKSYKDYGERGIYVCDEWHTENFVDGYLAFKKWAYANGYYDQPEDTPKNKLLTIDRIDNDGPYAPWNCRWTDMYEQSNNRGKFNQFLKIDGKLYTFGEAERIFGMNKGMVITSYKNGWTTSQIINKMKHPNDGYTHSNKDGMIRDANGFIRLTPKIDQTGVRNKYHGN